MANVRNGNTHYVDSVGALATGTNVKVVGVIVVATAANAAVTLSNGNNTQKKMELRVAASGDSHHFRFEQSPVLFPDGIYCSAITTAIVTVIYSSGGGS